MNNDEMDGKIDGMGRDNRLYASFMAMKVLAIELCLRKNRS